MRVAVVGAGGLGGYFGALLARAGHDVTVLARGPSVAVLQTTGITLRSSVHGDSVTRVAAAERSEEIGAVDLVLVCVKTYDLAAAARQLPPLIGPTTVVLPVQNGIDAADQIAQVVGNGCVLGGATYVAATREAPAVVRHTGGTRVVFGELAGGASARTTVLQRAFRDAGVEAEAHPDIRVALWEKFAVVCATGGVAALTRLPKGPLFACPETRAFFQATMGEAVAVGRTAGVALAADYVTRMMPVLDGYPPWGKSSMLVDLEAGRRLELDAITGAAVRLGQEHRVLTPANTAIYAALKPFAAGPPVLPSPPT